MFYFCICSCCEQGVVMLFKDEKKDQYLLLCDDCETLMETTIEDLKKMLSVDKLADLFAISEGQFDESEHSEIKVVGSKHALEIGIPAENFTILDLEDNCSSCD